MKALAGWALVLFAAFFGLGSVVCDASAEEGVFVELMPYRYAHVDGDNEKFRAQHWMTDRSAGGIKDARLSHVFKNGVLLHSEGHAIGGDEDYGATLSLEKEEEGFLHVDFSQYKKWFDGTGGTFYRFNRLQTNDTDRDLDLDIGHFIIEGGITPPPGNPQLGFEYEHEFKDGAKSRLTWPFVYNGGDTRKIAPSWQEINEEVDAFTLKLGQEAAGFNLGAKQRWEFVRTETSRFEQQLTTNATASQGKIRKQTQNPETDLMTTTLTAERGYLEERGHFSTAYNFAHMDARELESIFETNAAGQLRNFSFPEQKRDARSDVDYDAHTWVGSTVFKLLQTLTVTGRLKAEMIRQEGNSIYPADASPNSAGGSIPNGVIDQQVVSLTENKIDRFGEALLLRYSGIPRTSLFAEAEMEQSRIRMYEDRKDLLSPGSSDTFNRFTIGDVDRATFTVGGQASPLQGLNVTAHGRHRLHNNDYDDQRETVATGARSAFFDGQKIVMDELATRASYRWRWLHPSVRYQLRDEDYETRAQAEGIVETEALTHIITADLSLQPLENLLTTFSYSRQLSEVRTPARLAPNSNIPSFHTDWDTWLASADWSVTPTVTLTSTLLYAYGDNFNDFSASGLPYGLDEERWDVTGGLRWSPAEDFSLGANYAYYFYAANPNSGSGDYDAHVISVEGSKKF